jgi:hypothetical protein
MILSEEGVNRLIDEMLNSTHEFNYPHGYTAALEELKGRLSEAQCSARGLVTEQEMETIIVDRFKNYSGVHWYRAAAHAIAEEMKRRVV